MIQRIQSIYLLLGALAVVALLLVDVVWQNPAVEAFAWFAPAVLALGAATAVVGVVAIFLYRDRKRQRRVAGWALSLALVLFVVLVAGLVLGGGLAAVLGAGALGYVGLALPLVALVCFYLARRAIQRDIDLVRSMDRLR